jgi:putative transposase
LGFSPISTSACSKETNSIEDEGKEACPMLRTVQFVCSLPKAEADALNAQSGRIYTDMLVRHYRVYRKQGVWLAPRSGERLEDALGGPTSLHAHSRDAAQQGFYHACKTARACKTTGRDTKYPHFRTRFRPTIWKSTGITRKGGRLLLARARGVPPVHVALPSNLLPLPAPAFLEARLVWDRAARHYGWHLVVEDGLEPLPAPGTGTAAVDLGEIHPAAVTDGRETVIITCRALRANQQYTVKRLAEIRAKQHRKQKHSRGWKRLQRRKNCFLAKQKRRARDLEHKVSRAVVAWAKEHQVGTLVIGDVRDVADGKRLNTRSQQKIGLWSHGRQRAYITYKAEAAGMTVMLVEEAYTSQTCPGILPDGTSCLQCYKPRGRIYRCPACGFTAHRDGVGAANLLSQHYTGEPGHVLPPPEKYRHPFAGKRSRPDTAEMASGQTTPAA